MVHTEQFTDEELLEYHEDEAQLINDILPGNWKPSPDEWLEIAAEIIRATNRFRFLKYGVRLRD